MFSYNHFAAIIERFTTINEVIESAEDHLDGPTEKASVCAEYYRTLRALHDEADAIKKKLYNKMDHYGMNVLPLVFDNEGVTTITLSSGYRVTISSTTRVSIPADNKEQAYQWLVDNDLGDLITNTVNASTLSATARSMNKQGQQLPDDLFKTVILPQVSMTRVK